VCYVTLEMLGRIAIARFIPPQRLAIPLAAAALAIGCSAFAWRWAPAGNGAFDSAFYLDGARHLARGDGYVSAYVEPGRPDFEPITHWAPGTSVMIAALIKLGAPPLNAAAGVLGACYVAAVLLVFALGIGLAGARYWPVSLLASLMFAFQPNTLIWLDFVLSDLPCAAFALLCLWLGLRVMRADEPSLGLRMAWGACIAWLNLVRYAGLLFIPGMLIATALGMRLRRPLWARALALWPTVLTAAVGVSLWNLRNQRVAAKPLGGWMFVNSEPAQHVVRASRGAFVWLAEAIEEARHLGIELPFDVLLCLAGGCWAGLAVLSARTAWREATLVAFTAAGYYALMVATASVTLIASLSETRFWVGVWPLQFLLAPIVVARANLNLRGRWIPKLIVISAMACVFGLYANKASRDVQWARDWRGLLSPGWAKATQVLPEPGECRLYVNDPRPYMLNRQLEPTSPIPPTLAEFDAAVKDVPQVCVAISDPIKRLRLSGSAERRRKPQMEVVTALRAQNRLERLARRDGVTVYRLKPIPE
jgi:hypothetical protein